MNTKKTLPNAPTASSTEVGKQRRQRLTGRIALGILALLFVGILMVLPAPWKQSYPGIEASRKTLLNHHVQVGLWQAAAFGLAAVTLLLATMRWWWVRGVSVTSGANPIPQTRLFWCWMVPVLVLAICLRWPLLGHSVYGDEHYSITKFIHGEYRPKKAGGTEFREEEWPQTIWGYQRPNNHILFSIVARSTHTVWQKLSGADEAAANVSLLRLTSLAAAILSIGLLAWLLWRYGFRYGAIVAALLMALHPWHISHSVEVRGYSFVFLFITTTVIFALAALRKGSGLAWAALAVSQFCLLYTYPTAIFIAAPTSLTILVTLVVMARRGGDARSLLGPFLATQTFLGIALCFAYLPCVPQLREYLSGAAPKGPIDASWLKDVGSLYLAGRYWEEWEPLNPLCLPLANQAIARPWLVFPMLGLLAVAGLRGAWKLCRLSPWLALMLAPIAISIPIALLQASISGAYLYTWYLIMPLPLWLICMGVGVSRETGGSPEMRPLFSLRNIWCPGMALAAFLYFAVPQLQVITRYSVEPVQETFTSVLKHLNSGQGEGSRVYAMDTLIDFHDPSITKLRSESALRETMEKHRASGTSFVIAVPGLDSLRKFRPEDARLLEHSGHFRLLARRHGIEFAHRSYDVWVYGK